MSYTSDKKKNIFLSISLLSSKLTMSLILFTFICFYSYICSEKFQHSSNNFVVVTCLILYKSRLGLFGKRGGCLKSQLAGSLALGFPDFLSLCSTVLSKTTVTHSFAKDDQQLNFGQKTNVNCIILIGHANCSFYP